MSPPSADQPHYVGSFPRVSGDEPVVRDDVKARRPFSPRERG